MQRFIDTLGGFWELFKLAITNGFKLRGPYWSWRYETAFGSDPAKWPSRMERTRAMIDYGRWVYRMKRHR
ncbi:MAG: hypothetical protein O7G85_13715 [Planctomycetota bacterium]|nr:hypothetical protein [Planctomycetota bacterium]